MKRVYKDRLKKLADHLINGKLGHKKFDFSGYNTPKNWDENVEPYSCGYAGCAIGECPTVFKRDWKFNVNAEPVLRKGIPVRDTVFFSPESASAREFFGINDDQFDHLFVPDHQNPKLYGGRRLTGKAKAKSVANNILAFIAKQEGSK